MNDYLIEIIFRNVPIDEIGQMLKELTANGTEILSYYFTCEVSEVKWDDCKTISSTFEKNQNFGLFINLKSVEIYPVLLIKCGLCIYKNIENINLEFNFQFSDAPVAFNKITTQQLMEFSKTLAKKYKIEDYYCGIEPAEEKSTRLFTKENIGPFLLGQN